VNESQVSDRLTGPGAPFEIAEELVLGERMPVFKNRPRSARELLVESSRHGELCYIVHGDRRLSYDEYLQRVAAFAHMLREEFGVASGDRVAILAANSPEWIIAFWATVSIGAVVASMNSWWAGPEIAHALASFSPRCRAGQSSSWFAIRVREWIARCGTSRRRCCSAHC